MKAQSFSRRGKMASVAVLIVFLVSIAANVAAQDHPFIIWVFDKNLRDSQFGYYDGNTVQSTEPVFEEYDMEGLACLNNVVYCSSAMDAVRPSRLFTVAIDVASRQSTLVEIGEIRTANQEPFLEVAALSEKADGTLWGFASTSESPGPLQTNLKGLIRIDPTTAVAELVVPSTIDMEGIEWLGDTLWLVSRNKFYTWTPGGAITPAFTIPGVGQIEALDVVDGLLWVGIHNDSRGVVAIDPATGAFVPNVGFPAPDDIESSLKGKLTNDDIERAKAFRKLAEQDNPIGNMIATAKKLEGSVRNTGIHACGVIITPDDITDILPVTVAKDSDLLVTQFDNSVVEESGLLKMDFLGLKTLTIIKDAVRFVKEHKGIEIDIENVDLEDSLTYELFTKGETVAIFQYESEGMQKNLKDLKPNRFEDLIAMNALYRPGPIAYIPDFIKRKHGLQQIKYDLIGMESFLSETYGITVYQEQVMLLSQKLADFTKGEADHL